MFQGSILNSVKLNGLFMFSTSTTAAITTTAVSHDRYISFCFYFWENTEQYLFRYLLRSLKAWPLYVDCSSEFQPKWRCDCGGFKLCPLPRSCYLQDHLMFPRMLMKLVSLRTLSSVHSEQVFALRLQDKKLPPLLSEIWDVHEW